MPATKEELAQNGVRSIRATLREWNKWATHAKKKGMSRNEFIRETMNEACKRKVKR